MYAKQYTMFAYFLQLLSLTNAGIHGPKCKAAPGSTSWPSERQWSKLNQTLSGRLIKPSPPGAVCHPDQPTYNQSICPAVQEGWLTTRWHSDDPVSVPENNWNNDTCLPNAEFPCSGKGYPVYVVNATCARDVKRGVDFARKNNVRVIVKGTGHDYLGRSSAPNSLSIWTHHLRGLSFHEGFTPRGCKFSIDGHAISVASGTQMLEINQQAHARNLTIVSGGAGTVGVGGYLTGGGHAALSSTYGLAADQVLEMELVTPAGEILTINECQNTDLFWAMRGGGGSTFGVLTSVTIKAFPSSKIATASLFLGTAPGGGAYWDAVSHILSRFPELDNQGISCYSFLVNNFSSPTFNITTPVDGFFGIFFLPLLHATNTSDTLAGALNKVLGEAIAPFPHQFFNSVSTTSYDSFWDYYRVNNGPLDGNHDQILGSRLLDGNALSNQTAIKEAYKKLTVEGNIPSVYLVGGKNVMNAKPRGGSNAVNPAWRKAYVHTLVGTSWAPLDAVGKASQENKITNVWVKALRDLAPNMGAYINEADPNEPNFQQAFWGDNYPRLLEIKRKIDPFDVFWCTPCIGNERWKVVDDRLCRV